MVAACSIMWACCTGRGGRAAVCGGAAVSAGPGAAFVGCDSARSVADELGSVVGFASLALCDGVADEQPNVCSNATDNAHTRRTEDEVSALDANHDLLISDAEHHQASID